MAQILFLAVCIAAVFVLAVRRAPLWGWAVAVGFAAYVWQSGWIDPYGDPHVATGMLAWLAAAVLAALAIPKLLRTVLVDPLYHRIKGILPRVSATEQEALDAGTVGFDAQLFSGTPDWAHLSAVPPITLSEEEKAFLDGPVN